MKEEYKKNYDIVGEMLLISDYDRLDIDWLEVYLKCNFRLVVNDGKIKKIILEK